MALTDQIAQKASNRFVAERANPAQVEALRKVGIPEDALAFYREFLPKPMVEVGKVRLRGEAQILEENSSDIVPGCYAYPCGYITFANTVYGDSFCFDAKSPEFPASAPVVLIVHDLEPENDTMVREELSKLAKPVASSFTVFLEAFVAETLDLEPLFPPSGR